MNKSESQALTKAEQKEKIRQRYKGRDTEDVDVIPANKSYDFYDEVNRRVAVYVRVSTDNLQQTSSYELQKNYYEDMVNKNPHWELVHIYADEGISGTSLDHRDAFNQMIADCKAGKIDMIITKSVSRFARNVRDCITIVDELSELRNPIGVFFETEHIFTLDKKNEITLSFTASMAQEESHIKSNIMNASIEMRFSHGILLTPVLLGYDHDQEGNLVINKEEAETVRLIFFMYLYGFTIRQIAEQLTKLGRITKKGNTQWNSSSVVGILRNERYCGDVLTSKTFTPSYKNHKSRKNNGDRTQYRWKDQHEPIISRDDFIAVQHMMVNTKYGSAALPELKVIEKGPFNLDFRLRSTKSSFRLIFLMDTRYLELKIKNQANRTLKEEIQMSNQEKTTSIALDCSRYRIRIHANTLAEMGYPKYVVLIINPEDMTLGIMGTNKDENGAHRLYFSKRGDRSVELYSRTLIQQMAAVCNEIEEGKRYRFDGKFIPSRNLAVFNLLEYTEIISRSRTNDGTE